MGTGLKNINKFFYILLQKARLCVSYDVAFPYDIHNTKAGAAAECLCQLHVPMALLKNRYTVLLINSIDYELHNSEISVYIPNTIGTNSIKTAFGKFSCTSLTEGYVKAGTTSPQSALEEDISSSS